MCVTSPIHFISIRWLFHNLSKLFVDGSPVSSNHFLARQEAVKGLLCVRYLDGKTCSKPVCIEYGYVCRAQCS